MIDLNKPRMYGVFNTNRKQKDLWGKNEFNSVFPISLACYMRDKGQKAMYLSLNEKLQVIQSTISLDEVFCTKDKNEDLFFAFESKFEPYQQYSFDNVGNIDLVVKKNSGEYLTPLEVKLTVLPDNTTCKDDEKNWGSEIVIRPATTKYAVLGIINSCQKEKAAIRKIFEPVCYDVSSWSNRHEMNAKKAKLLGAIDTFEQRYYKKQKPLVMQTLWKTQGKSPSLADNSFDIIFWSDFAFTRLFLDPSKGTKNITRQVRSSLRFARAMYEATTTGNIRLNDIYTTMAFDFQTDKEFSVNGKVSVKYTKCKRTYLPIVKTEELPKIILNGGEKLLSPERRFDQTIYFTIANVHNQIPTTNKPAENTDKILDQVAETTKGYPLSK